MSRRRHESMSPAQLDVFAQKGASRHANDIKVLIPLVQELALKAGEDGVTIADIRVVAQQRLLLPQQNTHNRSLAWLGHVPRAAGLVATDRTRRSQIPHSNGNRHTVWVAKEFARRREGAA